MDPMGVGLALFSFVLFAITLGLSTRPVQGTHPDKKRVNAPGDSNRINDVNDQKTIVVQLPRGGNIPEDYTIDLKVSLSRAKKGEERKEGGTEERGKKFFRRLDEYL